MRERASATPVCAEAVADRCCCNAAHDAPQGRGAGAQMATRRKVYRQYGNRHDELASRLAASYMDLRLRDLPPSGDATVARTADYIAKLGEDRTAELKEESKVVHAALTASGDELKAVAR